MDQRIEWQQRLPPDYDVEKQIIETSDLDLDVGYFQTREAAEVIRRGDADVMLAGGTEAPICQMTLASFCAIRALSTRNAEPERASRPFSASPTTSSPR